MLTGAMLLVTSLGTRGAAPTAWDDDTLVADNPAITELESWENTEDNVVGLAPDTDMGLAMGGCLDSVMVVFSDEPLLM